MNENTSTCAKCGYTLAQHDYVHGARGNCGNFVDAGPFFDDRPLLDMNDITQLSTLYSNAIARAEKAEEALREIETAIDGGRFSEWPLSEIIAQCRMQSRDNLDPEFSQFMAEVANRLSTPPVRETP